MSTPSNDGKNSHFPLKKCTLIVPFVCLTEYSPGTGRPVCLNGTSAHYGVVTGLGFFHEPGKPLRIDPTNFDHPLKSIDDDTVRHALQEYFPEYRPESYLPKSYLLAKISEKLEKMKLAQDDVVEDATETTVKQETTVHGALISTAEIADATIIVADAVGRTLTRRSYSGTGIAGTGPTAEVPNSYNNRRPPYTQIVRQLPLKEPFTPADCTIVFLHHGMSKKPVVCTWGELSRSNMQLNECSAVKNISGVPMNLKGKVLIVERKSSTDGGDGGEGTLCLQQ